MFFGLFSKFFIRTDAILYIGKEISTNNFMNSG